MSDVKIAPPTYSQHPFPSDGGVYRRLEDGSLEQLEKTTERAPGKSAQPPLTKKGK